MMNLEFMSCILYGLKEIYSNDNNTQYKNSIINKNNKVSINNKKLELSYPLSEEDKKKYIKGPKAIKNHKILYQKLFSEEDVGLKAANKDKKLNDQLKKEAKRINNTNSQIIDFSHTNKTNISNAFNTSMKDNNKNINNNSLNSPSVPNLSFNINKNKNNVLDRRLETIPVNDSNNDITILHSRNYNNSIIEHSSNFQESFI